jgi:uncharacterized membrane protein
MQVAAIGALMMLLAYAVRVWPDLPATVPIHFGSSGAPDGWGKRATLLILPMVATVHFLVLTALERVPHLYNYPLEVTAKNAPVVYALSRRLTLSLKLIIVVAFGFIFHTSVQVALGEATALPGWFLPALLGSMAGVMLVTFVRLIRLREPAVPPVR